MRAFLIHNLNFARLFARLTPVFLLKKRPSFARLFTKMSPSEELVTLHYFLQYNQEDADEYKCAVRLEKYFDKELSRVGLVDESQYPKVKISKLTCMISRSNIHVGLVDEN